MGHHSLSRNVQGKPGSCKLPSSGSPDWLTPPPVHRPPHLFSGPQLAPLAVRVIMPTCGWCLAHLRCLALGRPVMSGGGIWDVGGHPGTWPDFSPHTADPLGLTVCGQPGNLPKTCWGWPATTQSNRAPSPQVEGEPTAAHAEPCPAGSLLFTV